MVKSAVDDSSVVLFSVVIFSLVTTLDSSVVTIVVVAL